jgi:energy-coupling factor transporter ATP-binding protein EcfA2
MPPAEESAEKRYIQRVLVTGLFGQFDHDLNFGDRKPTDPNLLILYGENGTGKTTLLWLVYHLLNKQSKEGHRTFLATQMFKKLEVTFSDGFQLSAERGTAQRGSFVMKVVQRGAKPASFKYDIDKQGSIPPGVSDQNDHRAFNERLPTFNFGFLPYDRSSRTAVARTRRTAVPGTLTPEDSEQVSPIRSSINNAIGTAQAQAIMASNQGQLSVNAIYTELIRQIALVPLTAPDTGIDELRFKLLRRLQEQAALTQQYSEFGLTSELQVEGLLETLKTMPPNRFQVVDKVLEPFLQGNEARLAALNALYIALTTTVETVNSLFLNKKIILRLDSGVGISTTSGILLPEQLSSGEKELLILFCEVISEHDSLH